MATPEQFDLLSRWDNAKKALAAAQAEERILRDQVIAEFSTITNEMHSGTETIDLAYDDYELKIVHNLKYELDKTDSYAKVHEVADKLEKLIGEVLTDRLFKQSFELSVSEYKRLADVSADAKKLVDGVLTIKPASKQIEIKKRAR